jgi:hypothetical protein
MAEIYVAVRPDTTKTGAELDKKLGGLNVTKSGEKVGDSFGTGFGHSLKKLAGLAAGALASRALVAGVKGSISAASDLNETVSKTDQIFGKSSGAIKAFAKTAPTALGQTRQAALDANATFGLFGKSAGLTGGKLVGFTTKLTTLAGDLASFNNTSPEQAIEALGAALRGESEPIRSYGVLLDDATLKAEAMSLGLLKPTKNLGDIKIAQQRAMLAQIAYNKAVKEHGKNSTEALRANTSLAAATSTLAKKTEGTTGPLTQQQKVLAAQSAIMKQTTAAQGDFARTSGGLANQQRIAAAQTDKLKIAVGTALLPVVLQGATALNQKLLPPLIELAEKHGPAVAAALTHVTTQAGPFITSFLEKAGPLLSSLSSGTNEASPALSSLADSGAKLGPVVQDLLNKIPSFTDVLSISATAIGFLADHTDTLGKLMPLLVAGILAYKAAQLAANVAALLAVPTKFAEVVVNRQLVASNRALIASRAGVVASTVTETAATAANTGAKNAGIVASIRQRAAAIASAITTRAVAAATAIWTGAQWLLNAALTANPIGLVIAAIALLAVGIVLLWKRSETFRAVMTASFNAIKSVVVSVIRVVWSVISGFYGNLLEGAARAFGWVPGLGPKLRAAATWFGEFRDSVNNKLAGLQDQDITIKPVFDPKTMSLASAGRRAAGGPGGPVDGPGTTTNDKAGLYALSRKEWVIKARSSMMYGDHAMASVNAGTATIIPHGGFAAGGRPGLTVKTPRPDTDRFASGVAAGAVAVAKPFAQAIGNQLATISPGLNGVLSFIKSQVGKPYLWGGVGPGGYDCSGLVSAAVNVAYGKRPYSRLGSTKTMPWSSMTSGQGPFMIGWTNAGVGHTAATVNGVNIESSGGVGVHMGASARGAANRLFTHRMKVKGFAAGGSPGREGVDGQMPFDLVSRRGRNFLGQDVLTQLGVKRYDRGGAWPNNTLGMNTSGKTETVVPGGGAVELGPDSIRALGKEIMRGFSEAKIRLMQGPGGAYLLSNSGG